jgi:hypothetical protein
MAMGRFHEGERLEKKRKSQPLEVRQEGLDM